MNRKPVLLAVLLFVLAAVCVWQACKMYEPSLPSQNETASVTTSEVILNGEIDPPYPADNWWNIDVSCAPVDVNSASYISWIGVGKPLHPDWGVYYGIPYVCGNNGVPLVEVDIYAYPDESDPGPYPVPVEATYDWRYVEQGSDHHLIILNTTNGYLYELFGAEYVQAVYIPITAADTTVAGYTLTPIDSLSNLVYIPEHWMAKSGAIFDTKVNYRRPEGWTSADASGMAIMPGLVKWSECNSSIEIHHAHRFTIRATNGYCWPANHAAGTTNGAPPLGARLRLRHDFPIAGYSAPVQRLLQSFKRYGLILADNGSDMFITGTMDERWIDMAAWNAALATVTAGDFEVIELGWTPPTGTGVR